MLIKRITTTLHDAADSAGTLAKRSVRGTLEGIAQAPGHLADALPSKEQLKNVLGSALITGGKVLIDPRAAIGEAAVRIGESLLSDPARIRWFVIRVDAQGASESYAFHDTAAARECLDGLRRQGVRAYLCEVTERPD